MSYNQEHKGNQLFSDCQMMRRETPSQREFMQVFSSEIPIFGEIITSSFERLKRESSGRGPSFQNRNWNSNTMNSNIQGLLIEHYGGSVKMNNGRFFLKINGKLLFFKKLESNSKLPMHNPTWNSRKLVNNCATLFEEPDPIIWIGYCVDNSWANLLGVYAESIEGRIINWITDDLTAFNFESTITIPINSIIPNVNLEQKPLVSIKTGLAKAE